MGVLYVSITVYTQIVSDLITQIANYLSYQVNNPSYFNNVLC